MSWFKEWWKTTLCSENKSYKIIAEAAYKAALEKAVENLEQYIDEWNLSDLDEIKEQING